MKLDRWTGGTTLIVALSLCPRAAGQTPDISHDPVGCIVAEQYPRLEARFNPEDRVGRGRLRFRPEGGAHWYSVPMKKETEAFVAVLPRPTKSLKRLNYYVEVTAADFETGRTPEYAPVVISGVGACESARIAGTVGTATVLLEVPSGAPALPLGFSDAGVVSASATTGAATGGTVAGAGTAGVAAAGGAHGATLAIGALGIAGAVVAGVAVASSGGNGAPPVEPPTPADVVLSATLSMGAPPPCASPSGVLNWEAVNRGGSATRFWIRDTHDRVCEQPQFGGIGLGTQGTTLLSIGPGETLRGSVPLPEVVVARCSAGTCSSGGTCLLNYATEGRWGNEPFRQLSVGPSITMVVENCPP